MRLALSIAASGLSLALLTGTMEAGSNHGGHGSHGRTSLFTPPLVPADAGVLDCYLANVSNETRDVTIRTLRRDGTAVDARNFTLEPLTERVVTAPASEEPRYCQFLVEGAKSAYRGSVLVREPVVGTMSALPTH